MCTNLVRILKQTKRGLSLMTFKDWIFSSYPNPGVNGQFGLLHILTLCFIALFVTISTLLLKDRKVKTKRYILIVIASIILFFEVSRRIINIIKTEEHTFLGTLRTLLPRPGCAISCWLVMFSVLINKKSLYNFASIIGLLSGVIFFAYPGVGFNNQFILFENLYSIVTHTLFTSACFCFITYKFTDFKYKNIKKELLMFICLAVYVILEIVLKIEADPFYFMPSNDIQKIVSLEYAAYIILYALFFLIYFNAFYIISDRKKLFKKKR